MIHKVSLVDDKVTKNTAVVVVMDNSEGDFYIDVVYSEYIEDTKSGSKLIRTISLNGP